MKLFFVFAALVAAASATTNTTLTPGLRVTFGYSANASDIGVKYFFDLPKTDAAAIAAGWTLTNRPSGPLSSLKLYCASGRAVCTLHEYDTGYVAGLQLAIDKTENTKSPFSWEAQGYVSWTPSDDGKNYWATQQFFVDETYLCKSAAERIASRDSTKTLQLDGIWATGQELTKISTSSSTLTSSNFVRQNCYGGMGYHYYLNMSKNLACTAETLFPWFALVDGDELVGSGLIMFGQQAINPIREWFERQTRAGVAYTIYDAPTCLLDLCDDPGIITIHINYVDKPQNIIC